MMPSADTIADRLIEVRQRIDAATVDGQQVTLVAVSKRFGVEAITEALAAGALEFGENYAQELAGKADALAATDARWHMIGPVQRNKVRRIASHVDLWHSVDRPELMQEIAKRTEGDAAILVQVNYTGEDSKSGVAPAEVDSMVDLGRSLGLDVRGLMAMGPTDTSADPRPVFVACRSDVDRLGLSDCSIGMSGDFESAIAEGSTMVRVGSAIFGPRP